MMEIREFAEQLLFGETLEDKLIRPTDFSDHFPGPALERIPVEPGRPIALRFESADQARARKRNTNLRDLEKAENRGALLHHFANHEILAVELMALALLRFPDAPSAFRMSLVRSIGEEQRHFLLYRSRMRKIGFDFGDLGINDFFWKHLAYPSTMRHPVDFAVRMGMTFEQANLDYMQHYAAVFARLGDRATVAVLEKVLLDEIGHVKNGVHWFEYFRNESGGSPQQQQSQWEAYRSFLPEGLSPVRARGFGFHTEARKAAGLSDEYIEALRLYAYSRGRPPALYWFNPGCEEAAAEYERAAAGVVPAKARAGLSRAVRDLELDLEMLMLYLAGHEDALLVREAPHQEFLKTMHAAGFPIPEIYPLDPQTGDPGPELLERKLGDIRPWGLAPDSLSKLRPLFANVIGQRGQQLSETGEYRYLSHSLIYSRSVGVAIEHEFARRDDVTDLEIGTDGRGRLDSVDCETGEAVSAAVQKLKQNGESAVILKARFGTAGRNRHRVQHVPNGSDLSGGPTDSKSDQAVADSQLQQWLARHLPRYGGVIVEPWLADRCVDFSVQFTVESNGHVVIHGVTRLFTDHAGHFIGNLTGRIFDRLSEETRRRLADSRRGVLPVLHQAARFAGAALAARGYSGPAGIDAFAWWREGELYFRPICEINPRFTMGRVALEVGRRVLSHRAALWITVTRRQLEAHFKREPENTKASRSTCWADWAKCLMKEHPLRFRHGLIDSGVLFTTDPTRARDRCTFLLAAPDFDRAIQILESHGIMLFASD